MIVERVDRCFAEAIKFYSEAVAGSQPDAPLFSNRSAAYLACGMAAESLQDAARAVTLHPNWPKARYR